MNGLVLEGVAAPPLANVRLVLEAGEIGQVVGPNGSGKSLLLALAAGLVLPAEGSVHWQGEAPTPGRVGLVFQNPDYQLLGRTVAEEITLAADDPDPQGDDALALVGCDHLGEAAPDSLSPGQRRRVALAAILASGVSLVLLDNPLADCGPEEGLELWRGLRDRLAAEGRTVLTAGPLPGPATVDRIWDVREWQP